MIRQGDINQADINKESAKVFSMAPAPVWSCTLGGPSLTTIYGGHYTRMMAVIEAARTGNETLITLALEHHDKHGSGE